MKTDLSAYNNQWYQPGSFFKRICWHYVNLLFFKNGLFPFHGLKIFLLRLFGARVGRQVKIKPFVNIKYPWLLQIGDFTWIGENVWIDNLAMVTIGSNACLSQGATLLTGNHDYTSVEFKLLLSNISIEEGVWIGAGAVVCPGVICKSHSVLMVASVAAKNLEAFSVYQGNPAVKVHDRTFR